MKVSVIYVFPLNGANGFFDLALRFIESYNQHPPGMDHKMVVVCNGSPVTDEAQCLFGEIPNCEFLEHDNSGYDCGAYQKAAREVPADLMVFFGATSYLKCAGWLVHMVEAWKKHGDTIYGTMGNRGHEAVGVHPHVRTTCFWISPSLFNQYPHRVTTPEGRYPFEHGPECLTTWIKKRHLTPYIVAVSGAYRWEMWDHIPGGFHRGAQEGMLAGDKLSCPPYHPVP